MFTKEEIVALLNLVDYASKDITEVDEPLINILYRKLQEIKILKS